MTIKIVLWIALVVLLLHTPTYLAVRGKITNWETGLTRLPLWKALITLVWCRQGNHAETILDAKLTNPNKWTYDD